MVNQSSIIEIDGVQFQKSSFSAHGGGHCVGVACKNDMMLVINTNTRESVARFTKEEWQAFVAGVKNGEFDID